MTHHQKRELAQEDEGKKQKVTVLEVDFSWSGSEVTEERADCGKVLPRKRREGDLMRINKEKGCDEKDEDIPEEVLP